MTSTQKRWVEIPLLIFAIWFVQALQISILRLPFVDGAISIIPILIIYLSLTRTWGKAILLTLVFSYLDGFTAGINMLLFASTQLWTSMITKLLASGFTVDSRNSFATLVALGFGFTKTLTFFVLSSWGQAPPLQSFIATVFFGIFLTAGLAYLLLPLFVAWDDYFEHSHIEAAELSGEFLKSGRNT